MIVIADTGPINYLVLIGEIEVLPALYHRVLVPPSVCEELKRPRAPETVRTCPHLSEYFGPIDREPTIAIGSGCPKDTKRTRHMAVTPRRSFPSKSNLSTVTGSPMMTASHGRRIPSGPARAFLTVIAREPDAVRRALLA